MKLKRAVAVALIIFAICLILIYVFGFIGSRRIEERRRANNAASQR